MTPYYEQDGITLYHGDCREILPQLGRFDLLLTDPPYGIEYSAQKQHLPNATKRDMISGDDSIELAAFAVSLVQQSCSAVIFGANCFPQLLPHRGRWLCWDKRVCDNADRMLGSPFELAWENRVSGFDVMIRVLHGGVVNADGGKRCHPTQKPVVLFRKIVERYSDAQTILDPFAGSGTTLLAAKLEGRKAVGIEISERYCEIAANRLRQKVLF